MQIITDDLQKEKKEHGGFGFPILVSHERLSNYETASFLWHWHPEIELTYVVSGEMLYSINDKTYHLKAGDVLFGNQSTLHEGHQWEESDCEYIAVTFLPKLIYGFEGSLIQEKYVTPITERSGVASLHLDGSEDWHQAATKLLKTVIASYETGKEMFTVQQLLFFWQILYEHFPIEEKKVAGHSKHYDQIRDMISYIENHYTEQITLDDVAVAAHLSRSECSRVFKKVMGTSLFSFIQNYRIEKSCALLTETDAPISEIAESCGFSDGNYYTKVFQKVMGCSPSTYRKKNC
ncbi:MAG: helix-turn-helix domain-containing protein [Lachnospiraceae bacterium]|nr:helix-turn-helix domain-containing protein [Lachnospiraceae bacterium]